MSKAKPQVKPCGHDWTLIGVALVGNGVHAFDDLYWCRRCGTVKKQRKGKKATKWWYPKVRRQYNALYHN